MLFSLDLRLAKAPQQDVESNLASNVSSASATRSAEGKPNGGIRRARGLWLLWTAHTGLAVSQAACLLAGGLIFAETT